MKTMNRMTVALAMVMCLGFSIDALAAVPQTMTYHGTLKDSAGQPLDATVEATFRLYDAASDGTEVWSETFATVDVNAGSFTAQLGGQSALAEVFDGSAYWLEVTIEGETLSPRTPVESVPYALRAHQADRADSAERADDADTVGGQSASDLAAAAPTTAADLAYDNTSSGLSAADVQAALDELAQLRARVSQNEAAIATVETDVTTAQGDIAALQTDVTTTQGELATLQTDVSANTSGVTTNASAIATNSTDIGANTSDITTNTSVIATNASAIGANTSDINALQTLTQDMARTTINGQPAMTFTGVNVHVRNGVGATDSAVNGVGNLIVGYDEARANGSDKSGSHNLVVGRQHNYTSYAGLIAGDTNTTTGPYSSVSGGQENVASGHGTSVSGGKGNTAAVYYASVTGGRDNTAAGNYSSINGGKDNNTTAAGVYGSIGAGQLNIASGWYTSVSGGRGNTASGEGAAVSGGLSGRASGSAASVGGGYSNLASGMRSSVNGGNGLTFSADYENDITALETLTQDMARTTINGQPAMTFTGVNVHVRSGAGSTDATINGRGNLIVGYDEVDYLGTGKGGSHNLVVGAEHSYTSHGGLVAGERNSVTAAAASVTGGYRNIASGVNSSISGGSDNEAIAEKSALSGGWNNTASGVNSWVSGGSFNKASGVESAVSGGWANTASGEKAAVSGGRGSTASGFCSTVGGGMYRSVNGSDDWAAGGLFQTE